MDDSNNCDKNACTSSTWALPAAVSSPPDEISLFLQQILLRSSSTTTHTGKQPLLSSSPSIFSELTCNIKAFTPGNSIRPSYGATVVRDEISAVDTSHLANSSSSGAVHDPSPSCPRPTAANASSTSVGASENENDEFDCESEEGLEALIEEHPTKRNLRNSSKRSRAAEVHNLSEKRRRSRINEKMKALQNLIPNSNKTDKASMLDEAIEYLKQLQLQVQMLSMRHGLSLHPMNLPGSLQYLQLSHMRMEFGEENRTLPLDQERPNQIFLSLPNQRAASMHPFMPDIERISAGTPFELEPSIQAHLVPFNSSESSKHFKEICREDHQLNVNQSETIPFVSHPYNVSAPDLRELQSNVSVEPCTLERNQSAFTQEDRLKQQSYNDKDC